MGHTGVQAFGDTRSTAVHSLAPATSADDLRSPGAAAADYGQTFTPESPSFKLVGTIIGEDNRIGIFMSETSQTTIRIREGEG